MDVNKLHFVRLGIFELPGASIPHIWIQIGRNLLSHIQVIAGFLTKNQK